MSSEPVPFTPEPYERPQTVPNEVLHSGMTRRGMLRALGLLGGAAAVGADVGVGTGAASAAAAPGVRAAASAGGRTAVLPKGFTGDITDIKHVVILMQENRSFDHYYGALPGVRGFDDKQALRFQNGTDVFSQPQGSSFVKPSRVTTVAGTTTGLDHSYEGGTSAWNGGRYNNWIGAKGANTMHHLTGEEIPWQYSLASAYTICDNWHCSVMGPTTPNRLFAWTGTSGGTVSNGGESDGNRTWQTYPEALQKAGVSWRIYVDNTNNGSSWVGDYTDNPIRGFSAFTTSGTSAQDLANRKDAAKNAPGTGLVWRAGSAPYASTGVVNNDSDANLNGVLKEFIAACAPGAQRPLPQVSWIVAPYSWSEHPSANPEHGAHFCNRVIQTLRSNPEIAAHTLLIMTFDENDGYFDHVLPPYAEPGTPDEYNGSTPIGYGARIPTILVSPWTRGGWVSTETFDHTSLIRFLETWTTALGTPALSTTISAWRRAISGDLTSAMDFAHPVLDAPPSLPDTDALVQIARAGGTIGTQVPPADRWSSTALRRRPLSYHPHGTFVEDRTTGTVRAQLSLVGGPRGKAVSLQAFPDKYLPFTNTPYTVSATKPAVHSWDATAQDGRYAFSVYGPDGFVRAHAGTVIPAGQNSSGVPRIDVELVAGATPTVRIALHNDGRQAVHYSLVPNDHAGTARKIWVAPGATESVVWPTEEGYYDVVVTADTNTGWQHRYAGRIAQLGA
ncbi:alkaline phosphatase family protein [uncultured Microbacterium sp.]|uniref:alkaline phosphatase family protein n=1 Tax=uncultured Microbacterium sp. TaxID=191216 RepID=UPI0025E564CA|nr:alkaline phosphatase family protein [uncultured Microbacterium sp.]